MKTRTPDYRWKRKPLIFLSPEDFVSEKWADIRDELISYKPMVYYYLNGSVAKIFIDNELEISIAGDIASDNFKKLFSYRQWKKMVKLIKRIIGTSRITISFILENGDKIKIQEIHKNEQHWEFAFVRNGNLL